MLRYMKLTIGLAALAILFVPELAQAQIVRVYSNPPLVVPSPVVNYSYYYPAPTTVYYSPAPVTYSYYAPAPVTYSYYAPAPVTYSYYAPATTAYYAPTAVTPGVLTTRSYYGLGIFRPLGWTTQSYFTPAPVVGPVTSYYAPVYIR